jgi:hypothetical protein
MPLSQLGTRCARARLIKRPCLRCKDPIIAVGDEEPCSTTPLRSQTLSKRARRTHGGHRRAHLTLKSNRLAGTVRVHTPLSFRLARVATRALPFPRRTRPLVSRSSALPDTPQRHCIRSVRTKTSQHGVRPTGIGLRPAASTN